MRERILVIAVALALVTTEVAGVAGASAATDRGSAQSTDATQTAKVTISNQTSGGTTVTVDSVTLSQGGFVAIHAESLTDGKVLESVVGASTYLSAGTHENVTVRLDEPIDEDTTLIAMPHKDTDGDRIYEFVASGGQTDGPYTSGGNAVVDTARVAASATVSFSDQPSNGSHVVIDRVEMAEGGFVAIHNASLLNGKTFDSVIGVSGYLPAGVHENVRVELEHPIEDNGTLIPMPHRDTDGDESYDFVTSEGQDDAPYTTHEGDIVLTTGKVTVGGPSTVTMNAQVTGGTRVVVDSVFVPDGGFVTVHDETLADGEAIASVRGTSGYLEPGLHRNVAVTLDGPFENDSTAFAMPHRDTDGDESYDFVSSEGADDAPYTRGGGAVFDGGDLTVSGSASVEHQTAGNDVIVVDSVDLSEGGFVTIHDASLLEGEPLDSVRGTSAYLEAGVHEDVRVRLNEPLRTSQLVIAMPHRDTDGDRSYDFVTSGGEDDAPYTAGGSAVVDTAKATVNAQTTFTNQSTDGGEVTVRSVTLHDGGFVTIHDASLLEGEPLASVRGTSEYLGPGTHTNVTVSLSTEIEGDGTFIAMPHRDTDDDQSYDFVSSEGADDAPYLAGGGAVVDTARIDAPATASVTFADQTTEGDELTVASVTLSEGGFVTVHDSTLLDGAVIDSVRGTSAYLEAGSHEDVTVPLDEPVAESGQFVAMPHLDTNGNEEYDFVSSGGEADGPYTSDGSAVTDTAMVTLRSTTPTESGGMGDGDDGTPTNGSGPGFGVVAALIALLGAALIGRRR